MTSEELANAVEKFIKEAQTRVLTVGKQQYVDASGQQLFEKMPLAQLLEWTREELNDTAVYTVMLDIRIQRLKKVLEERGLLELREVVHHLDGDALNKSPENLTILTYK